MSGAKGNLYNIHKQGHLKFSLRPELAQNDKRSDSGWEHPVAAVVIMTICCLLDFVMFQQLFSSFLYDSMLVQRLSILAMLIGFDLAPIYLGIVLKKRSQGINTGVIAIVLLVLSFLIALVANVALRIAVKDLVLPDLSTSSTSVFGEVVGTDTTNDLALLYAVFASAMPLITSLVSFAVSFYLSNPLKSKVLRLQEEQIALEDAIVEIEALLTEYETDPNHFERLIEEDEEKYQNMKEMIHEKTLLYCDYVRQRIKEHLGDPTSNNELSKDKRAELMPRLQQIKVMDFEQREEKAS